MAEKDIHEKLLLSHADVFADCVNALAYSGRQKQIRRKLRWRMR